MMRNFFAYVSMLVLTLSLSSQVLAISNKEMYGLAHQFMQHNHVPGLSIAIVSSDKITTYNYGYADELNHVKTSDQTIYRIASFSKTYTATLAALAQVEGKDNLNDSISTYLPELTNAKLKPITIKMLLAHVAGMPFDFSPSPQNYTEAIKDLNHFTPTTTPGTEYSYSNMSIGLNAYILQNIYQQSYETLLQNKIIQALNLKSTYLNLPKNLESLVALGHRNDQLVAYNQDADNYPWFAAASLKSNITDMAKFLQAQFTNNANDENLNQALTLVHQNYYCFANRTSCEQLSWQAHLRKYLDTNIGDTYFKKVDEQGNTVFAVQKIVHDNTLANKPIFIDKTCGGYGMSGYMLYDSQHKVGVVVLLNRSLGNQPVGLGREILQSLTK